MRAGSSMRRLCLIFSVFALALMISGVAAAQQGTPPPSPHPTPSHTVRPRVTPSPTGRPHPTPSPYPSGAGAAPRLNGDAYFAGDTTSGGGEEGAGTFILMAALVGLVLLSVSVLARRRTGSSRGSDPS
jgi:hypothetical protein